MDSLPGSDTPSFRSSRRPNRLTATLYRFRTEGSSPIRQALAVALGLFIGASPFYGFHLLLSLALGRLFRLNRLKVYLAANISIPLIAPFLIAAEIQTGAWLRTGRIYTPSVLDQVRLRGLAADLLMGSVVVGLVLAVIGGLLTYAVVGRHEKDRRITRLVELAAERYLREGLGVWEFSRAKLQFDPVYLQVLADGVLPDEGTIVDLGCGQGLMLSLLTVAREEYRAGRWPDWPPPPLAADLKGIELRPRMVRRARKVLDGRAIIEELDLARADLPPCQAVLVFDVLHLLPREAQDDLLKKIARALDSQGVLVLREADAAGGWRFAMVRTGNWLRALLQGKPGRPFHFRSANEWRARLQELGFSVESASRGTSTLLANFLVYARPRPEGRA